MIRNLFKLQNTFLLGNKLSALKNISYARYSLHSSYSYKFSEHKQFSHSQEMYALQQMLGIKQQPLNEDITQRGDIRLVSESGKQLGIYTKEQALNEAKKLKMDLVLVSDAVTPIICKIANYKEDLYKKFIKEIVQKDSQFKQTNKKKTEKKIQLSTNISMGDLHNKASQAADFAKKYEKFLVYIYCNDKNIENSKNILQTFQDLVKSDLTSEEGEDGEIQEYEVDVKYLEQEEIEEEESQITRKIQLKFQSASYVSQDKQVSETEIKQLVAEYFKKNKSRILNRTTDYSLGDKEMDSNVDIQQGHEEYSDIHFDELVKQTTDESVDHGEDMLADMKRFAEQQNVPYQELVQNVEELKLKYNAGAGEAIVQDLSSQQEQRWKNVNRILRLTQKQRSSKF